MTSARAVLAGAVGVLSATVTVLPGSAAAQRSGTEELLSMSAAVQEADYRADLDGLRRLYFKWSPCSAIRRSPGMPGGAWWLKPNGTSRLAVSTKRTPYPPSGAVFPVTLRW